ncbi:NAD(P)-binding protein [Penicillium hetheringtonii]|uniref:NAD(P)-binding protein n=1 Tax=Penicillium hetheringtonii TaxID=911720 RepID=A0AAD6E2H1_9EURO|nr:NAD(P)-binding protein [Penicillium hetheringtonii]
MPTAIVTGATGITGSAIVSHLIKDSSYTKIYTLSRSNAGFKHPKVQHVHLDLQGDTDHMAKELAGISAEHIFFCAYLASDDPSETDRINASLLSNFLEAIVKIGGEKQLKRFILTCGFKQYGVHLGRVKQPLMEGDPLLQGNAGGVSWPPIFYYSQQQVLADAAKKGNWEWVCTLPEDVLGFAKGNFMNEATAIGLYCAVSKAMPGSELPFPGNKDNFFSFNTWTSANLHAKFCLWAASASGAGNQIFNVTNGDSESFQNIWPKLADRFGCKIPNGMFSEKGYKNYESSTIPLEHAKHPLILQAESLGLSNDPLVTDPPTLRLQIDPEKWAKRADVNQVWGKLRDQYGLDQKAWEKATWDFLTFVLGRDWSCIGSMSKARKLGWTGYADTWDELVDTFERLEKEGILPPLDDLKKDY